VISDVRFVHLDVGQGTGTFVEIYDTDTKGKRTLAHTMLLDFGSDYDTEAAGGPSVDYVVMMLKEMAQPTIDALVLSHSDTDHTSLMGRLFKAFTPYDETPSKSSLRILYCVYGGTHADYTKHKKNVLSTIKQYMVHNDEDDDQAPYGVPPQFSSFASDPVEPVRTVGGVRLFLVVGNHPNNVVDLSGAPSKKRAIGAYAVNTVSLVSLITFRTVQMLETGDSTGATMCWCNAILDANAAEAAPFKNNVWCMSVPHHGSSTTGLDLGRAGDGGTTAAANVTKFAKQFAAKTYVVSAAEINAHLHPSAELLRYFWNELPAGPAAYWTDPDIAPNHYYTAFYEAQKFKRVVDATTTPITTEDWPPVWGPKPVKVGKKAAAKKKAPAKKKGPAKPPPAPKMITAQRLTVQTPKNLYSTVYYAAGGASSQTVLLPPEPGGQGPTRTVGVVPPLGVAWTFTVTAAGGVTLAQTVNRPGLLRLRAALAAGVPPEQLPDVPASEVWPDGFAVTAHPEGSDTPADPDDPVNPDDSADRPSSPEVSS
jgi:hypothetical protein